MTLDYAVCFRHVNKSTSKQQKKKIYKLDFIIKNFCASKDTIKLVRRQPIEWKEMFTDYISGKGLVSRLYKEHLQLKGKKDT